MSNVDQCRLKFKSSPAFCQWSWPINSVSFIRIDWYWALISGVLLNSHLQKLNYSVTQRKFWHPGYEIHNYQNRNVCVVRFLILSEPILKSTPWTHWSPIHKIFKRHQHKNAFCNFWIWNGTISNNYTPSTPSSTLCAQCHKIMKSHSKCASMMMHLNNYLWFLSNSLPTWLVIN